MPRGNAKDRLSSEEAEVVRGIIREARDLKGLKNRDLANLLNWDVRQVTGLLNSSDDRPLRAEKAAALLRAVGKGKSRADLRDERRQQEQRVTALVSKAYLLPTMQAHISGADVPAMLVAPADIPVLADYLANEVARVPGFGRQKRDSLKCALEKVIARDRLLFADAAERLYLAYVGPKNYRAVRDAEKKARTAKDWNAVSAVSDAINAAAQAGRDLMLGAFGYTRKAPKK